MWEQFLRHWPLKHKADGTRLKNSIRTEKIAPESSSCSARGRQDGCKQPSLVLVGLCWDGQRACHTYLLTNAELQLSENNEEKKNWGLGGGRGTPAVVDHSVEGSVSKKCSRWTWGKGRLRCAVCGDWCVYPLWPACPHAARGCVRATSLCRSSRAKLKESWFDSRSWVRCIDWQLRAGPRGWMHRHPEMTGKENTHLFCRPHQAWSGFSRLRMNQRKFFWKHLTETSRIF